MLINEYPLTDTFYLIAFEGSTTESYHMSKDYSIIVNKHYGCNGFMNRRDIDLNRKQLMGKVLELTEKKAVDILDRARIKEYTNYQKEGEVFDNAKDSIISYLQSQDWAGNMKQTYIIVPKKSKKLTGTKIKIQFDVGAKDFGYVYGEETTEVLDVYMTPLKENLKEIKFSMMIPERLYEKAMKNNDIDKRPKKNYFEVESLSALHREMENIVNDCHQIWKLDRAAEKAKKVIVINFNSSEIPTKDSYNFAYTGQQINTQFNFFVAYQVCGETGMFSENGKMFNFKQLHSGTATTDKGRKGIIDYEKQGLRRWIKSTRCDVIIDWSQEKEDFLIKLEGKFRELSENLNAFLKDLNEDKLLELMKKNILANNTKLLE